MYDQTIHYSKTLWNAFVVDDCKLKNLTKLLQDRIGDVTFSAEFVHGVSRRFETVGDLIDYENPKSKEILNICLHAESDDLKTSARISFLRASGSPAISISLDACEIVLFKLLDEIQDVIRGMRPWYDVVSRYPSVYSLVIACFGVLIGGIFWIEEIEEYIKGVIGTFEDVSRRRIKLPPSFRQQLRIFK